MPKTLSLGQYGMTRGVDRILKILEERGIRATFFTPGWVAEQYPDKLKAIVEKGHEIAALGYHHEHMALLSEEEQESAIKKGIAAIEKVCGVTPKGFRSPEGELTLDTLRIAKKNGLVYSSNLCDDDRPYWKDLGEDKILEIPIHWVNYDLPYFAFNYHPAFPAGQGRIANYTGVLNNWKDEFFGCHEYGRKNVPQSHRPGFLPRVSRRTAWKALRLSDRSFLYRPAEVLWQVSLPLP